MSICLVSLKGGHVYNLILHNIVLKVPYKRIEKQIIGRRVLESIGCDSRLMFVAACNRDHGEINVGKRLVEDEKVEQSYGNIAGLFGESAFHYGRSIALTVWKTRVCS